MEEDDITPYKVMHLMRSGTSATDAFQTIVHKTPEEFFEKEVSDGYVWAFLLEIGRATRRKRIRAARTPITDLNAAINLIRESQKIVVIIGAGASVGPDFRSKGGLYDSIAKSGLLDDPYKVFDLDYFKEDPTIFWKFAHTIFPAVDPEHSQAHYFLEDMEKHGKLLRLYSQNVDTLERGIPDEKLRCVHGSWRHSHCLQCGNELEVEELRPYIEVQSVPTCPKCGGQIKPGIVFFGQKTNIEDEDIQYDSEYADLLIVIGTSLRVAPVSMIPNFMSHIPSILINREPVTCSFSCELLGDCDTVVKLLENQLGWTNHEDSVSIESVKFLEPNKFTFPDSKGHTQDVAESGRLSFMVSYYEPDPNDLQ